MGKHQRALLCLVLPLLLLAVAAPGLADALQGKWKHSDGSLMEFMGDGMVHIRAKPEAEPARLHYIIEGNNILTLVREDDSTMSMRFRLAADGKRLTLTSLEEAAGGQVKPEVLQRVD
ncbi:MAG: hypothetical protein ACOZHQ_02430 [Thermodesulfobacteriota bacterium]